MSPEEIIRTAFKRSGIKSDLAICDETGLEYKKLHCRRLIHPGTLTLSELWLFQRHADFTDEELLQIVKGGMK